MFGIDVNDLQNKIGSAYSSQPTNQYQTSPNQMTPDNTSWMAPSGGDSTIQQPDNQNGGGFNWMAPNGNTGVAGNLGEVNQTRQSIPQGDGTAISAVQNGWSNLAPWETSSSSFWSNNQQQPTYGGTPSAGNVGQYMPGGYDQGKWNDPNKHDPKYDSGRILSKYPPGPAGLDQAMNELTQAGFKRVGKDSIYRPDVGTIDVGKSFSSGDPNQMSWQWQPVDDGSQQNFGGAPQQQQQQYQQPNLPVASQLYRQRYARLHGLRPQ